MDFKPASLTPEGMPLNSNSDPHNVPAAVLVGVDPNASTQMTQLTHNNSIPPPLYYNINLPPDQPSTSGISDRGAPPSYEEAIDPNGIYSSVCKFYQNTIWNLNIYLPKYR